MTAAMIQDAEVELVEAARAIIRSRFKLGWHAVGSALRTRSGRIHVGVHLECSVGRIAVCAEAIAIGRAVIDEPGAEIASIVAVQQESPDDQTPTIVSPCGMCREMISDYAPICHVIVPGEDGPQVASVASLLPQKYRRRDA
jgi:cytidine deaminase